MTDERDRHVSQGLAGRRLHGCQPRHAVGHRDDVAGDAVTFGRPGVQPSVVAVLEGRSQSLCEGYAVLNAGVHALSAGWAVHMSSVAAQENPAVARTFRHAVVDAKPRAPNRVVDASRICGRPAPVQYRLHISHRWRFRRVVYGGDNAKTIFRQGRDHHQPVGRIEQRDLVPAQRPIHVNVGQYETLLVFAAGKRYT